MEAILTTVLAAALVAVLLLVFVVMPAAVLFIIAVQLLRLGKASVDAGRAFRDFWRVASRSPLP